MKLAFPKERWVTVLYGAGLVVVLLLIGSESCGPRVPQRPKWERTVVESQVLREWRAAREKAKMADSFLLDMHDVAFYESPELVELRRIRQIQEDILFEQEYHNWHVRTHGDD